MTEDKSYLIDEDVGIGIEKIDVKWVVARHIDRLNNLCAITQTEKQVTMGDRERMLSLGVALLEKTLMFYLDDKYNEEANTIPDSDGNPKSNPSDLAKALHKFGCLMKLLGRHGFLMRKVKRGKQ